MKRLSCLFLFFLIQFALVAQDRTVGTILNNEGATGGYTLFSPAGQGTTYLINNCGQIINTWQSEYSPGASVYLLQDGSIMRSGSKVGARLGEPGVGGIFERIDWDGDIIWTWEYSTELVNAHHDFHVRANGNLLIIAWELKTAEEAIAAGRDPNTMTSDELWPDHIIEVEPQPNNGGEIVWEWHAWDHLIQDFDETKQNYGVVENNPGKIDINYRYNDGADWNHLNSIHFDEESNLIVLSTPFFNEIWIIDRNTTTEEAQGVKGDLLFRWGNPATYGQGIATDQKLFFQHTVEFIDEGLPYEGKIIIFNNGRGRTPEEFSSVDILDPFDEFGDFYMEGNVYGPAEAEISYSRDTPTDLFASFISGAQMLPNGNFLITDGPKGTFIEVDLDDNEYWKYTSPISVQGIVSQGDPANGNLVFRATRYEEDYLIFNVTTNSTKYIEKNPVPLDGCLPLAIEQPLKPVILYPNPVKDRFSVNSNFDQLTIVDISGRKQAINYSSNSKEIDISHLGSGVYYLILDEKEPIKILKK